MASFFGGYGGELYYPTITAGATTFASNVAWNVYRQQQYQQPAIPVNPPTAPRQAGPETAVEWLDRRVNEMRVAL